MKLSNNERIVNALIHHFKHNLYINKVVITINLAMANEIDLYYSTQ